MKVDPSEYPKAVVGGVIAGIGVLYLALTDNVVTLQEWVAVAQAAITTFAGVWGIPNAPKKDLVSSQTVTVETKTVEANGPEHRADKPLTGL